VRNTITRELSHPDILMAVATICLILNVSSGATTVAADSPRPQHVKHVSVYAVDGRYGGWPANHGIWSWGDEILVGFSAGYYQDRRGMHAIDRQRPEEHLLARSLDGGETWKIENPGQKGMLVGSAEMRFGTVPEGQHEPEPSDCPGGISFTHLDFAMTCRMRGVDEGASRFYYSYDRGRSWKGPFRLPLFGQPGIASRTDYIVNGPDDCFVFLTASKTNGREGRPILVRTVDGGKTWKLVSLIGPEPAGFSIMPSSLRLSTHELLTTVRCESARGEERGNRIEVWHSPDNGLSWSLRSELFQHKVSDNPPHMIRLADGRLCVTYGRRAPPLGIYAAFSTDEGKTWSEPLTLRDDGASSDLGYTRTVQRRDGRIVTVYYYHDKTDVDRTIAATIWSPPDNSQR